MPFYLIKKYNLLSGRALCSTSGTVPAPTNSQTEDRLCEDTDHYAQLSCKGELT